MEYLPSILIVCAYFLIRNDIRKANANLNLIQHTKYKVTLHLHIESIQKGEDSLPLKTALLEKEVFLDYPPLIGLSVGMGFRSNLLIKTVNHPVIYSDLNTYCELYEEIGSATLLKAAAWYHVMGGFHVKNYDGETNEFELAIAEQKSVAL